jgi:hypothetical protein
MIAAAAKRNEIKPRACLAGDCVSRSEEPLFDPQHKAQRFNDFQVQRIHALPQAGRELSLAIWHRIPVEFISAELRVRIVRLLAGSEVVKT